jgi:hypothetical protein
MPRMGFEPKIPASKRAKTVHVLDRAANVIVPRISTFLKISVGVVILGTK